MKLTNVKTVFNLMLVGVAAATISACSGSSQAATKPIETVEPNVIVVTPTATEAQATPDISPTVEIKVTEEPTAVSYKAGTLLKGSGDGVFYLREDGTRQHIYNWDTFLAFGFKSEAIVEVDDETLDTIPVKAGSLTRLVRDEKDNLYWVDNGRAWRVNRWRSIINDATYVGVPPSDFERTLLRYVTIQGDMPSGSLLKADQDIYYVAQSARVVKLNSEADETKLIDIPAEMLEVYSVHPHLSRATVRLKATILSANVRSGPSLEHNILGTVNQNQPITVMRRTEDGQWLQVYYQKKVGWLASSTVKENVETNLLAVIEAKDIPAVAATEETNQPEATAETTEETAEAQPIYCNQVPIRGFGKVWGDHPEIQNELGCPNSWNGGERGTKAAVQKFEHGIMVWLESDTVRNIDPVYVFFNDGSFQRFGDLGPADAEKVGEIPKGFYDLGDKFGKVYWEGTGARVKERLGYATGEAKDSAGAFQLFKNGRMFWVETMDSIFVVYEYSNYNQERREYDWTRRWESYEDKF